MQSDVMRIAFILSIRPIGIFPTSNRSYRPEGKPVTPRLVSMGEYVHEKLGAAVYTIAFDAFAGERGLAHRERKRKIGPAPAGTQTCSRTGHASTTP